MWERAWREHDAEAVSRLYTPTASFRSHPFREPRPPAEFAAWAFESERPEPDVRFGRPLVGPDGLAAVEYWAVVADDDGVATVAGVSLLRFDDRGLVVEERDYWNEAPGRHEPPPGWGT